MLSYDPHLCVCGHNDHDSDVFDMPQRGGCRATWCHCRQFRKPEATFVAERVGAIRGALACSEWFARLLVWWFRLKRTI